MPLTRFVATCPQRVLYPSFVAKFQLAGQDEEVALGLVQLGFVSELVPALLELKGLWPFLLDGGESETGKSGPFIFVLHDVDISYRGLRGRRLAKRGGRSQVYIVQCLELELKLNISY